MDRPQVNGAAGAPVAEPSEYYLSCRSRPRDRETAAGDSQPNQAGQGSADADLSVSGERRQVTVMFCDLVGSTELSQRLDPEDLRDVIRAFRHCSAAVAVQFGGRAVGFHGDALVAIFGYPCSQEDAPARAIRASLEIITQVGKLKVAEDFPLKVHVGIATGLVVIFDEVPGVEPEIIGEAPNLAARLQQLAGPGDIVVAPMTRRLAGQLFEFSDLGPLNLKGFTAPIRAWQVRGVAPLACRFEAFHSPVLTEFVGRNRELDTLLDDWRLAMQGEGRTVLVSGEAGIGKSRLLKEFSDRSGSRAPVWRLFGSPLHSNTALQPFTEAGRRYFESPASQNGRRGAALEAEICELGGDWPEQFRWLSALLGFETDDVVQAASPQQRKEQTFAALLWLLRALARSGMIVVIEDAQWLDPSSIEFLDRVVDLAPELRLLLIISFRPDRRFDWGKRRNVASVPLDRLNREETAALVSRVSRSRPLPAALVERIVLRTDGVPLFVEELTEAVLGSRDDPDKAQDALPATLHDSLLARLDQLPHVKALAQVAAVVGREFRLGLLARVARLSPVELYSGLATLADAGLIFGHGNEPSALYAFKHALVQAVAYDSLLKRHRRMLHLRVARALEEELGGESAGEAELLAHHFAQAGLPDEAVKNWAIAARKAFERSANLEVIAHTTRGLAQLAQMSDSETRRRLEIDLQLLTGAAAWATRGFSSQEVERAFSRAEQLLLPCGASNELTTAFRGLFGCYYARGELPMAWEQAQKVMSFARLSGRRGDLMVGHLLRGQIRFWQGQFSSARAELESAIGLYDLAEQRCKTLSLQIDPGVNARMHLGWSLWMLGYPNRGLAAVERATADARLIANPFTLAMALFWNASVRLCCGDRDETEAITRELTCVAAEHHISYLAGCAIVLDGAIAIQKGDMARGFAKIGEAFAGFRDQGAGLGRPWAMSIVAEGWLRRGEPARGLAVVEDCLTASARRGEMQWDAELHRMKGELLAARPQTAPLAAVAFRQAITTARRQEAQSLELRAALSLGRLMASQGNMARGIECVASVYRRFGEGFETDDLQRAHTFISRAKSGLQ